MYLNVLGPGDDKSKFKQDASSVLLLYVQSHAMNNRLSQYQINKRIEDLILHNGSRYVIWKVMCVYIYLGLSFWNDSNTLRC